MAADYIDGLMNWQIDSSYLKLKKKMCRWVGGAVRWPSRRQRVSHAHSRADSLRTNQERTIISHCLCVRKNSSISYHRSHSII